MIISQINTHQEKKRESEIHTRLVYYCRLSPDVDVIISSLPLALLLRISLSLARSLWWFLKCRLVIIFPCEENCTSLKVSEWKLPTRKLTTSQKWLHHPVHFTPVFEFQMKIKSSTHSIFAKLNLKFFCHKFFIKQQTKIDTAV